MKNHMNMRFLLTAVILFLTLALFTPACLYADSIKKESAAGEKQQTGYKVYINPLYEDIVSKEEILARKDSSLEEDAEFPLAGDPDLPSFDQVAPAAAEVRKQLADHSSAVTIGYHFSGSLDGSVLDEIFEQAMAHTGNPKEGDYIRVQLAGACYQWSYVTTRTGTDARLIFWVYWITNKEQERYVDERVAAIIADLKSRHLSTEETVRFLYEYLCDNIVYDYDTLEDNSYKLKFTAYAGLKYGTAVCNGYAVLLYRLLLEAGIDARVITGGNHAWNIVQMGYFYYNLDATWDAEMEYSEFSWFLKSEKDFPDHTREEPYNTVEFARQYPMSSSSMNPVFFGYTFYGDLQLNLICGEYTVVGYYGSGTPTTLDIPAYVNGYPVTRIAGNAFNDYDKLTSVTLPKTLKRIENGSYSGNTITGAFSNCDNLASITAPEGMPQLQEIGAYAFYNCDSIERMDLPSGVKRIGPFSFAFCDKLREVRVYYGTRRIEIGAFYNLTADIYLFNRNCMIYDDNKVFDVRSSIHGYSDSTAAQWAEDHDREFFALDEAGHKHDFVLTSVIREPTCLEEGLVVYTCRDCYETRQEEVDKTQHIFGEWQVVQAATCTREGLSKRSCGICEFSEEVHPAPTGLHSFGEWKVVQAATCISAGWSERFCESCGKLEGKAFPEAYGHSYGEWQTYIAPTQYMEGAAVSYCTRCGASQYKTLSRLSPSGKGTSGSSGSAGSSSASVGSKIPATDLKLNVKKNIKLKKGKKKALKVTLLPMNSTDKVTFKSSKKSVASVSSKGLIKAKKKGKTTITIKAGKVTKRVTLTVK